MPLLGSDRRRWAARIALYLVVLCGVVFMGTVVLAGTGDAATDDGHVHVIAALESSISLLKWVGGAIITGLVTALGLLYRALEVANKTIREDLMNGMEKRAQLMTQAIETQIKLTSRVDELAGRMTAFADGIKECPYLKPSKGS